MTAQLHAHRPVTHGSDRTVPLRRALRTNAAVSIVSGLALAVAPDRWNDLLDTGRPGWIRLVGVAVVLFGVDVAVLAGRSSSTLRRVTPAVVAADAAWVLTSAVTILAGWYSAGGNAAVAAMAAAVGALAAAQFVFWRRLA